MDAEAAPWKAAHFAKERRGKITSPEAREAGLGPTSNEKNSPESRGQRGRTRSNVQRGKRRPTSNVQRSTKKALVHRCTCAQVHKCTQFSILNPQSSIPNSYALLHFLPCFFQGPITSHQSHCFFSAPGCFFIRQRKTRVFMECRK